MSGLLPLAEAQARLLEGVAPLAAEPVEMTGAIGRVLAEPLHAFRTQPAADLSAMDGYAVRADDLAGPWHVVGESAAGHPFAGTVAPGQAVRISTGALVPAGAGAILLQEDATRSGDALALNGQGDPEARHIRRAGFDFRTGDPLLEPGTLIGPAQAALAMAGGHGSLLLYRKPAVAILNTGDELAADPTACAPHQIPASNGLMIAGLARPFAAGLRVSDPVRDDLDALVAMLASCEDCDVIVTTGGVSVGDHDLIRPALEAWGAEIDFWRVAMRPGKPLLVARKGRQIVLGLPGNPVSSFVTAVLFLQPLLRRLSGMRHCLPRSVPARLTAPLSAGESRTEFVRAVLDGRAVTPLTERDSSALRSLAAANALIERAIGAPAAPAGSEVRVYPLENGGVA
ncbi:MAG: molybdopterin molybdenumtransferase MoeA [Sphingomonadales bacterium 32-68-7]|nr:MAG: molybdopterin molybdenumtransferase MoeA [Sphingomonadales bacterium 12-68-11]OYX09867.1 MAG: molybdopterin molybdenumtransferase MoeA [Sphingomonadales bacterium 32-68-7]